MSRGTTAAALASTLAVALAACGGGGSHGASSSSRSVASSTGSVSPTLILPGVAQSPTPQGTPLRGVVVLPSGPADTAITVVVGAQLSASLPASPGYHWTMPISSDQTVVRAQGSATYGDGNASATFLAVSPGTAVLKAEDVPAPCSPPCGRPAALWQVTVTVVR